MKKILRLLLALASLIYSHQVFAQPDPGIVEATVNQDMKLEGKSVLQGNPEYMQKVIQFKSRQKMMEQQEVKSVPEEKAPMVEVKNDFTVFSQNVEACSFQNKILEDYHRCVENSIPPSECTEDIKNTAKENFTKLCGDVGNKTTCECSAMLEKKNGCEQPAYCEVQCQLSNDDMAKLKKVGISIATGEMDEELKKFYVQTCESERVIEDVNSDDQMMYNQKIIKDKYSINDRVCSCMQKNHCVVDVCQSFCQLPSTPLMVIQEYAKNCEKDPNAGACNKTMAAYYKKVCMDRDSGELKSSKRCLIDYGCYTPPEQKECPGVSTTGTPGASKDKTVTDQGKEGVDTGFTKNPGSSGGDYMEGGSKCSMLPANALVGFGNIFAFISAFTASLLMMTAARFRKK